MDASSLSGRTAGKTIMTLLSIMAVLGGAALLIFMPVPKDRLKRISSQGLGAVLFASGLMGVIYTFASPVT